MPNPSPARAWLNQHRACAITKDAFIEWDDDLPVEGGDWNVTPISASESGA